MITIESNQGSRIKNLKPYEGTIAWHSLFGFIPENQIEERIARRKRHGHKIPATAQSFCRFSVTQTADGFSVSPVAGCEATQDSANLWTLKTDKAQFSIKAIVDATDWAHAEPHVDEKKSNLWKYSLIVLAFLVLSLGSLVFLTPSTQTTQEQITLPVQVTVVPPPKVVQKAVTVPSAAILPQLTDARLQDKTAKRAIQQNLGFLGMLGKKNLSKAIGGMPSTLQDASPGAGPGGKEGSGGEFLQGLGQGVRRATVGNTGVAGLGGIGTKGVGGGAGGYGNTMVGSGEGRALSNVAVSNDMILEGGLDRAVIQATIAKYLSQVRACYEAQLQSNPGLAGQVTIAFTIDGAGDVASSRVGSSTLGNQTAESCIATKLKSWKFPKPLGGVNVKVNYPFLLRPVGT